MTHLPDNAPTDGRPGPGNRGGSGNRERGPRIADIRACLDGGRVVRALAWARSGDQTPARLAAWPTSGHALVLDTDGALTRMPTLADGARASQPGALHLGRPAR